MTGLRTSLVLVVAALGAAALAGACATAPDGSTSSPSKSSAPIVHVATQEDPIDPLPLTLDLDARKVALGRELFADPLLSPSNEVACTTCHLFERGGADGRQRSDLAGHAPAVINTPTIFNLAFEFRYQWSGKFDGLEAQLEIPVTSPRSLATSMAAIVTKLRASRHYAPAFEAIYGPTGASEANFRDAMATYERSLITPNAPFDRHLMGEASAITDEELAGYELFKSYGCISCHQGVNVGGNLFERFGVMRDYFADRGHVTEADLGRFNVTHREEDRFVFRVASLRNVAVTAPYFHDGSAETLESAVQTMGKYQLGRRLTAEQTRLIVAFLKTLTGEYDGTRLQ